MSVQSCIEAYTALAQDIFTPRSRTRLGGALLHKMFGSATFSAKKLEAGIKEVIRKNNSQAPVSDALGGMSNYRDETKIRSDTPEDMPMLGTGRKCKVCVCFFIEVCHRYD
jgi:hypothetical protein